MSTPELTPVRPDAASEHAALGELLPWYVNGTLDEPGVRRVESHLPDCERCRAQVQAERAILRSMRATQPVELAPQAGLASVLGRIDRREARRRWWRWNARWLAGEGALRPLGLAVGVQAVVIVMLTAVLWRERPGPATADYRALSNPAPAAASTVLTRVRVVFDDSLTFGEVRAALEPWRSHIVGGPEGQGIYTLEVQGDAEAVVAALRVMRGVRLAEVVALP